MFRLRLILRQITRSKSQAAVFVLCVTLSVVTLVAVNGFSEGIRRAFEKDAKVNHGADVIAGSSFPFSQPMLSAEEKLRAMDGVQTARLYSFYAMARTDIGKNALLAAVKVVPEAYPLYGRVVLASGGDFKRVLGPGKAVVEQALLDRMDLDIGDFLLVGDARLAIADVVISEPDRPVQFFRLGPRIFVSDKDLDALGLVTKGSRVGHRLLVKTKNEAQIQTVVQMLSAAAVPGQERVDTFREAGWRLRRFYRNFLLFLRLTGVFTLFLAGVGIHGALSAYLRTQRPAVGIMKAVGADHGFILTHYLSALTVLGVAGTLLGFVLGAGIQVVLWRFMGGLLPPDARLVFTGPAVLEGIFVGVAGVALFTVIPISRLKSVGPMVIFRKEGVGKNTGPLTWGAGILLAVFFVALVLRQIGETRFGLYFLAVLGLLLLACFAASSLLLWVLSRVRAGSLSFRQAVKGMNRPGNATLFVVAALCCALTVLLTIYLAEKNLDAAYVRSYPEDSANLFFLDIQPGQLEAFKRELGKPARYFPAVRARVYKINDKPVDLTQERNKRRDNLGRTFSLTWSDTIHPGEVLVQGEALFDPEETKPQVSILDRVTEISPIEMGDEITFKIHGAPLTAKVVSVRKREKETISPFFYFLFPPAILRGAPAAFFTAIRVDPRTIPALQRKMAAQFPNVSSVDATSALAQAAGVLKKLTRAIRFFTLLSLLAGMLIMVGGALATRADRLRESVYFKVLGATEGFVLKIVALEGLLTGLAAVGVALLFSCFGVYFLCRYFFEIPFHPFFAQTLVSALAALALVTVTGLLASAAVAREKPARFLSNDTE